VSTTDRKAAASSVAISAAWP